MTVVPLTAEHAHRFEPQPRQAAALVDLRQPDRVALLVENGVALAIVDGDRVLAMGGINDLGGGRGQAWCLLAANVARFMPAITRVARRHLDASVFHRVEIVTLAGWEAAERWALMLGFVFEGTSQRWFQDGSTAYRWGRWR